MARELTPKAYKRLLRAFTQAEAKITVDKWIDEHRSKYSSSTKKLFMDGEVYKYSPDGEVSKRLRLAIFRKVNTMIGKQMSKAEHNRLNKQKENA